MEVAREWDVAISFSKEDRDTALSIYNSLNERGLMVYIDEHARSHSVGTNLFVHLQQVYKYGSRLCVILISRHYAGKGWHNFELRAAQERDLQEEGYIIPVRIDNTFLDGWPESVSYICYKNSSEIADLVMDKLASVRSRSESESGSDEPRFLPESASDDGSSVSPSFSIDATQEGFRRIAYNKIMEITDPDLIKRCQLLTPETDLWTSVRLAADIYRFISWLYNVSLGPVYRCWPVGDRIFLCGLPGVIKNRQKTLEFMLYERKPVLIAKWVSDSDKWSPMGLDEFHGRIEGLMADRSGCPVNREAAILVLKDREAQFSFPVGPGLSAEAETLCGWREEQPIVSAFDWDRNPHLVGAKVVSTVEALHARSGAVIAVFALSGRWTNASLYAFRDAIKVLLPKRVDMHVKDSGFMRVVVYLCHAEPFLSYSKNYSKVDEARHVGDLICAAIARAAAALDDIPVSPAEASRAMTEPQLDEEIEFATSIRDLSDSTYPEVAERGFLHSSDDDVIWLDPRERLHHQTDLTRQFSWRDVMTASDLENYINNNEGRSALRLYAY